MSEAGTPNQIRSQCIFCKTVFKIGSQHLGTTVACPACSREFEVRQFQQVVSEVAKPNRATDEQLKIYEWLARPVQVAVATFLAGPLAGGGLIAMNHRRLGNARAAIVSAVVAILAFVGVCTFIVVANDWMASRRVASSSTTTMWLIISVVIVFLQVAFFAGYAWENWKDIWHLENLPRISFRKSGRVFLAVVGSALVLSVAGYFIVKGALIAVFA